MLPAPLSSHADMLIFKCGSHMLTSKKYRLQNDGIFEALEKNLPYIFIYSDENFKKSYPHDAIFNALKIGSHVFLKTDSISKEIISIAEREGLRLIHVNQGYPACVTLPLGEGAAITSDKGMALAMRGAGIRVYEIENSSAISLPPYEYGFIGGAAGVCGDTVYFIGDIDSHPSASIIKDAIAKENMTYRSLPTGRCGLLDLGRLIFC